MTQSLRLVLFLAVLCLATSCEICDDPNGCNCYMDSNGDGDGDSVTGRPVRIDENEACPVNYYLE